MYLKYEKRNQFYSGVNNFIGEQRQNLYNRVGVFSSVQYRGVNG